MFHRNEGPVPATFQRLKAHLDVLGIPHLFLGATALGVHGYVRATEDIDVCMRSADLERFRANFVGMEYKAVEGRDRRFYDPTTDTTFDVLVAGEIAGNARRQKDIRFPDPAESEVIDGTPVPPLHRLIELKLVTWRYKDWGDVVALISRKGLDETFADRLHPLVRMAYLECLDQERDERRYDAER